MENDLILFMFLVILNIISYLMFKSNYYLNGIWVIMILWNSITLFTQYPEYSLNFLTIDIFVTITNVMNIIFLKSK